MRSQIFSQFNSFQSLLGNPRAAIALAFLQQKVGDRLVLLDSSDSFPNLFHDVMMIPA
ncbi:MAG: hypothetical protein IGR76_06475 [Synechococcales cyanobacterium T60_A2020_003]|nr:hypothetical protein [Synechococcales cyanobacterium T60_A2020_003]